MPHYGFLILLLITSLNQSQVHAKPKNSPSVILGLTHSRTFTSSSMPPKPLEVLDVSEPLREFRDGYLISLNLGTPQQVLQVYMDTGSDLTWVPCGNLSFDCLDCDDYRNYKLTATFSPSYSSSSTRDLCNSPYCINIHSSDNDYDPCTMSGCSLSTLVKGVCSRPCPSFSYTYGAGGIVTGTLARDTLRTHGTSPGVTRDVSNFCFGCVGSTYREPIGIAGFGKGPLSLPSQLGFLQKGFSHCFLPFKYANNPNISSPLVIGDLAISSKENLQFTPMLASPMYPNLYYIGLQSISIGNGSSNAEAPMSLRAFDSRGNGGMLIDSGTTYTHLPEPLYSRLLSMVGSIVSHPRSTEHESRTGFDLCYKVPCANTSSNEGLPLISFHFLGNVTLNMPIENYFYAVSPPNNSQLVMCLLLQPMDDGGYGPAGVFGNFQQQNIEVVYDLERERIGFQPMDCASSAATRAIGRGKASKNYKY
ncbi:hypothetical protein ACLOJK_021542 [Asimina triloba]